ncbi:MAG: methyltransferase domain-containing protein [Aquabacterium sp.]|uniref:methyltransferase domain-containing protein n=1 Tax=Aquabacterium sp. TaxID=1872578 RepID=UPI0011F8DE99|nr:methyltransferase domain-containing protein [Aquabacterium sp.]TAK97450.1 MAG: methyltransferase domain-containing protein [Aquabacterium sp.]
MKKSAKQQANVLMRPAAPMAPAHPSPLEQHIVLTLYAQQQYAEAEKYAQNLAKQYPNSGFGWKYLGLCMRHLNRGDAAMEPLQTAAKLMPGDFEPFFYLGCTHQELGNLEFAEACYRHAMALKPDDVGATGNLAETLRLQNRDEEAIAMFKRKLELAPGDVYGTHALAMLTGSNPEVPPEQYISQLFDNYSDNFEQHLTSTLNYNVPAQLAAMLARHSDANATNTTKWDALDLGCGTGLVGAEIASRSRNLVGVDLSAKMLDKARARQVYQRLVHSDLLAMMRQEGDATFDVLVAADVFIYVGKLDDIVAQSHRLLRPNGLLAFSIETSTVHASQDYFLEKAGRYSQSRSYMERMAQEHGFNVLDMHAAPLRTESGQPVNGYLGLWQAIS